MRLTTGLGGCSAFEREEVLGLSRESDEALVAPVTLKRLVRACKRERETISAGLDRDCFDVFWDTERCIDIGRPPERPCT